MGERGWQGTVTCGEGDWAIWGDAEGGIGAQKIARPAQKKVGRSNAPKDLRI